MEAKLIKLKFKKPDFYQYCFIEFNYKGELKVHWAAGMNCLNYKCQVHHDSI